MTTSNPLTPSRSIGRTLLTRLALLSTALSFFFTLLQGIQDYQRRLDLVSEAMARTENFQVHAIITSLWNYSEQELGAQLEGMLHEPYFAQIEVRQGERTVFTSGKSPSKPLTRQISLKRTHEGRDVDLGTLYIKADLSRILDDVLSNIASIFLFQTATVGFIVLALFMLFDRMVSRHLVAAAGYFNRVAIDSIDEPLSLGKPCVGDELDTLVASFNRMRENLAAANSFNRQIINGANEGIVVYGEDLRYLVWNPFMEKMTGFKAGEVLGKHPLEIFPFLKETGLLERLEQALAGAVPGALDLQFPSSGRAGWFTDSSAPLYNSAGKVAGVIATVQDITERKRMEEMSQSQAQRLHLAVKSAHLGIWDWNVRENIMVWDDRMFELYGITPGTFPDNIDAWQNGLHPADRERAIRECQEALEGKREFDTVFRVRHPDGKVKHVKANGLVIRGTDGKAERMLGVNADITADIESEEERYRLADQLLQAQKMEVIGRLAGGVAHDFNNMLAVILGYTDLLKEDDLTGLNLTALDAIENAATRAKNITRQLLAFSRKQVISPQLLDLNKAIAESQSMLARLIGEDVKTVLHLAVGLGKVYLDSSQLDQIILNLAVNARDAMPEGGELELATENVLLDEEFCSRTQGISPGSYALLAVRDTGCGMDQETIVHIFEPFYTSKGIGKGTGLGLATVYGIVKQNHGHIEVESEFDCGTVFRIYFPQIQESGEENLPIHIEAIPTGTGTILLVEDDTMLRKLLRSILERLGYKVVGAATGEEALALFAREKENLDLLISDIILPGINGNELSKHLQAQKPELKILFISGYTGEIIASKGILEEGMNFLQKPFAKPEVARKVHEVMAGRS